MRSRLTDIAVSLASVGVALAARAAVEPALGDRLPFITFFPAVAFAAWFGGRRPGLITLLLSLLAVTWFVLPPQGTFALATTENLLAIVLFAGIGFAIVAMLGSLHRTREALRVTLASIGDGVITTDASGRVAYLNGVAEQLTGWSQADAAGRPLDEVFHILNEETREPASNPATRALREGRVVGLANHTILIARDGTERPIDDSAGPIRTRTGRVTGCVLIFRDVTEARASERRYRLLVDQSPDGIFIATADGRYVDVNPAGCAMLGLTCEELLQRSLRDVLHPDEHERLANLNLVAGEDVRRSEWRYVRKDGSEFVGELLGRRLPDGRLQGILRDITDRRRAEAVIAASAATFERLITDNPFGVYLVDADFRVALVARGARKVFSSAEPVVGRDLAETLRILWPEPFASEAIARFRHTLETGEPYESQRTVELRADVDGVEAYDWRLERIVMPDGRFGVVCYFYDLTERKDWEQRLSAATSAAQVGLFRWQVGSATLVWDERLRQWWGLAADEPVTFDAFLSGVHPDDRDTVQASVGRSVDPAVGGFELEYRVQAPGAPERWVRSIGRTEFVNGVPVSVTGGVIDITRHREQEAALREQDQRKDRFLATLSHELRNPLAPIRSAADLLAHPGATAEQASVAQRIISRQVSHMARLLDDLLDVARITQGKMVLQRAPVLLASLVDGAIETARPLLESRRHVLQVDLPDEPLLVRVDEHRMAQVLANLLTNAARYTEPGGHVTLRARCEGDWLELTVRDTGIGIPAESLASIFEMFSQVERKAQEHDGGLGIGLALVRGLVELHGGRVTAASDGPGRGAEFTVHLPACVLVPEAAGGSTAHPDGNGTAARRVLVADDNRDAADSLGELLRVAGHEVRVAYSGRTALAVAEAFRPDVLLLDLGMADGDGYGVATALRSQSWARNVRLVAVTGWGQDGDRAVTEAAGFDAHLVKPVEFRDIEALLGR